MKLNPIILSLAILLMSCATQNEKGAIGQLKDAAAVDLKDEKIQGNLQTAIQRLVDLKNKHAQSTESAADSGRLAVPAPQEKINFSAERAPLAPHAAAHTQADKSDMAKESDQLFERRATARDLIKTQVAENMVPEESGVDSQTMNTIELIALYKKFLEKYPAYERRDQVLYQISRSYEELGNVEESMHIIGQIVKEYPNSRYIDEFQFRRGEYYFTRKKYLDAEEAYQSIVNMGLASSYYELALYKLGWAFYKQDFYQEALHSFIALLDYKVTIGYDFDRPQGAADEKRVEDLFRVISLTFSNLGGASAIKEYFDAHGTRSYAVNIYSNLGEYYLDKRRYSDAALSYKAFIKLNPYHSASPRFDMRVAEIYKVGGFPRLVIDTFKGIAADYGLKSEYSNHNVASASRQAIGHVKASLKELANYYHALYQDPLIDKDRPSNFQEAVKWYREFLLSFPQDAESPAMNYQLADLMLENKLYGQAAAEYERIAYAYTKHDRSAEAGYAALYAHREGFKIAAVAQREQIQRDLIGSSWKFADTFPRHEKAAAVMEAATQEIYSMKEYNFAVASGRKLLANFPDADPSTRRSAWIIIGHSLFDLTQYANAQGPYLEALQLTPEDDPTRPSVNEYLAAALYKQGEQANSQRDFKSAAEHFFKVAQLTPASTIRPAADYDGATALIQLKQWDRAAEILQAFPDNYAGHPLQPEARKKLAAIYKETGQPALAAAEYQRVETELLDPDIRRDLLGLAADLYIQAQQPDNAIKVYRHYVDQFPTPLEEVMEKRILMAALLKANNDTASYFKELQQIVADESGAGTARTDRMRYLAASAGLSLAEPLFDQFIEIPLVQPFDQSLLRKSAAMKAARAAFENLLSYEVGDVTSAVTFYLAEMFYSFSQALTQSERPDDLNALEKEQYELSIEEQAYPFEEKAIQTHEKNLELMTLGVYSSWIDKSILKLAKLVPARYSKFEQGSEFIASMETFDYARMIDSKPVSTPSPAVPFTQ